jgi:tRNA dimethylallyltransferase
MSSTGDLAGDSPRACPSRARPSGARPLPVICGPTASGKSALALRLAEVAGASIISADSRQVYRGFDIGTAKPTPEERDRVPHFGIDVAEPDERYTAADWAAAVPGWVDSIAARGRRPILVGGTGFYLRALFEPLFDEPSIDPDQRASVREILTTLSSDEIRRWCEALDPRRAVLGRAQRERAIEVALITGHRISDLHLERPRATPWTARYLVLDPGPSLSDAIAARVDAMLEAGWLDEVRSLAGRVDPRARAWTATGYDTMRRVVTGEITLEQGRELVMIATRQYAKRQRTWFRHQLDSTNVLQVDPRSPDAFDRVVTWFNGEETR